MRKKTKITISYDPETELDESIACTRDLLAQGYSVKPIRNNDSKYNKISYVRYDKVNAKKP